MALAFGVGCRDGGRNAIAAVEILRAQQVVVARHTVEPAVQRARIARRIEDARGFGQMRIARRRERPVADRLATRALRVRFGGKLVQQPADLIEQAADHPEEPALSRRHPAATADQSAGERTRRPDAVGCERRQGRSGASWWRSGSGARRAAERSGCQSGSAQRRIGRKLNEIHAALHHNNEVTPVYHAHAFGGEGPRTDTQRKPTCVSSNGASHDVGRPATRREIGAPRNESQQTAAAAAEVAFPIVVVANRDNTPQTRTSVPAERTTIKTSTRSRSRTSNRAAADGRRGAERRASR